MDNGGGVLLPAIRADEQFAFCMCNPPFFETMAEAEQNPSTDFGGTEAEMCCEGGEDAFTRRIYADSLRLRERVHWYTTMCGKKDTMKRLRRLLEVRRVPAVRTATFHQGRTTRWGVAWSFARDAAATTRAPIRADAPSSPPRPPRNHDGESPSRCSPPAPLPEISCGSFGRR